MKKNDVGIATAPALAIAPRPLGQRGLGYALFALGVVFSPSLYALGSFAAASDLYSYILLIPVISGYMLWLMRKDIPTGGRRDRGFAIALLAAGATALASDLFTAASGGNLVSSDRLAMTTLGFVTALAGVCAWFLDRQAMKSLAFPLGFLVFAAPLPDGWLSGIETFMQHGSAAVARTFFEGVGTAVFYQDLTFQLPGIALHVAPECSGIRSTLVLLIVSVITGRFFLRSPTHRTLLALVIVPLALVRNGFRIFVIGELCVQIGPEMIDSFIHRRGGPFFFALSLIPLFLILVLLQRREQRAAAFARAATSR